MTLSRRETLQWMMTAAALPLARWTPPAMAAGQGTPPPFDVIVDWPVTLPPPPPASGYGRDPDLMAPKVPWPLTLSEAQRATVELLGDMILPADERSPGAGTLGVGAFVDEWISAPYPIQRKDREQVLGGLIWLDAQGNAAHGAVFTALTPPRRAALLDALTATAPVAGMAKPVAFMDTLRYLFVLGFYSLPEGKADMGFIGDQPTPGLYPGPPPEALAHLKRMLVGMGLAA
ncbi:gluconate 2-dehydrogenase subunit 3 family protein [Sphingomonas sp. JC676]|uniref:gluconate 2-dehydrogenase subunit 3 family protein n=1 Tax=Sphingomonas sp. JC676 TaxID=2768065 RepID=UPI001657BB4F|nr:gluconate 2-dehydrogenase subunit 3 family protein [Sphingomonas sp. JC676]MBC9035129.1 gluconate 2-dehydrogenase subunit 3 family protein [Sphingomonas sp. JC676]